MESSKQQINVNDVPSCLWIELAKYRRQLLIQASDLEAVLDDAQSRMEQWLVNANDTNVEGYSEIISEIGRAREKQAINLGELTAYNRMMWLLFGGEHLRAEGGSPNVD